MHRFDSLINDIKDFLMFGTQNDLNLVSIKQSFVDILDRIHSNKATDIKRIASMVKLKTQIEAILDAQQDEAQVVKFRRYKQIQVKLQHIHLFNAIENLRTCKDVQKIPSQVLSLSGAAPAVLCAQSRIRQLLLFTINDMKKTLLSQFHTIFENHLSEAEGVHSGMSQKWTSFLATAKDWLLSYSLICLLPVTLSESQTRVIEAYQEVLDEAFTPVWGRFHYHLEVARVARNWTHVIWTFRYAQSFVTMLTDLSSQMTLSGQLQQLCVVNYHAAGLQHVRDKALRFLRAHVAQVVVLFSPLSAGLCAQLVEECLELDEALEKILVGAHTSSGSGYRGSAVMSVSTVLYDSREVFHQWVHLEHAHFSALFGRTYGCSPESAFRFEFGDSGDLPSFSGVTNRCYSGVFACVSLLFSASERYRYLPASAQLVLAEVVLEPLLCTAVGLFLYRIRSHPLLYAVSCGEFRPPSFAAACRHSHEEACSGDERLNLPDVLVEFRDSVRYFSRAMSRLCRERSGRVAADVLRFRLRWSETQAWVPKRLLLVSAADGVDCGGSERGDVQTTMPGYEVTHLVNTAFQLPARLSCTGLQIYLYRSSSAGSGGVYDAGDSDDLAACVTVAVGLAGTLDAVMLKQFQKTMSSR